MTTYNRISLLAAISLQSVLLTEAFAPEAFRSTRSLPLSKKSTVLFSDWKDNDALDSNKWKTDGDAINDQEDWQDTLASKNDGTFWTTFDSSGDDSELSTEITEDVTEEIDESEAWLDTLASLQAEEVTFNMKEAERADKARQMQEWGFESSTIENTLGVAVDTSLEEEEIDGMQSFREDSYLEDDDLSLIDSHTKVPKDPETGDPVRSQMVYVDEHTCIGCTNCAMIAQSTFFMDQEYGRARVFQQWGDDDETIQIAIETCPVDCIHYVPYEELERLEVERRDQVINFKARLVNQQEFGGYERVSGSVQFSAPQRISGNMGSRCNNCPTRGCRTCPMYGVGKNPVYEEKEKARKEKAAKLRLQQERDRDNKSADL